MSHPSRRVDRRSHGRPVPQTGARSGTSSIETTDTQPRPQGASSHSTPFGAAPTRRWACELSMPAAVARQSRSPWCGERARGPSLMLQLLSLLPPPPLSLRPSLLPLPCLLQLPCQHPLRCRLQCLPRLRCLPRLQCLPRLRFVPELQCLLLPLLPFFPLGHRVARQSRLPSAAPTRVAGPRPQPRLLYGSRRVSE